jgi:hypothetical protein
MESPVAPRAMTDRARPFVQRQAYAAMEIMHEFTEALLEDAPSA